MNRIHLFEFTDLSWYPQTFRRIQTDYLQFASTLTSGHRNIVGLIVKAMQHAGTAEIVDLCSGGSGPWARLQPLLAEAGYPVRVTLTDKFPDPQSIHKWSGSQASPIRYLPEPVDATRVPAHLAGMRTLFEGFHHFAPAQARLILMDAAQKRAPIGIFEAGLRWPSGILLLLLSPLVTLLTYFLMTPWIKPRRFSRFLWTYLLPLVPLATCWDGIVSMLRVYQPVALKELTGSIPCDHYTWEVGRASTGTPVFDFVYLVGYPLEEDSPLPA